MKLCCGQIQQKYQIKWIKLSSFHVDQILLFVSDGSNDGGDPLEVIRDENQQLNNRVVIHTYGIGTGEW